MANNALVLGGGGVLGIAWEIGVLKGLHDVGADVTGAGLIVGTSAGSVVGTRIAQGDTLAGLLAEQFEPSDGQIEANLQHVDLANLMTIFAKWAAYPEMTTQACAEIGAMALASKTGDANEWAAWFEATLRPDWPDRPLLVTAVDAESGEFRAWSREDGVPVAKAVASSCSVPGIFPCVEINGRRYQDGGVRSGTSADLASGHDAVLMIAPIGARSDSIDPLLGKLARREADALRAEGSQVKLVFPDEASLEAMGINRMDTTRRGLCAEKGIAQGRALAERVAAAWSAAAA
jgi:NTE family protein